ncbi:AzlD domain-containing protein [Kroppenstedtia eburnea]|uniref:Branched-chain amino acid transport protein n=1 Tax=Kroppenstedtia eburnea TaxID=714067 RepID=A0A1N7LJK0_9BACL|nr:AzlD domain-containing protein [Kroppenstedtia eburnea]EGK07814.1 branched-chain amino acid transporter [Desmospora sp. 8437]QKI81306.1 AzlD domain-containing protein [Kroppenstedtia eburnea]SIS73986.1 Branched-chain amino acid transport protein [Kroppenstedtia eburnea]
MNLVWIILGMSLVTMLPRWLSVWVLGRWKLPPRVRLWLNSIPYAALGALIFPGILSVEPGAPAVGLVGGLVAGGLAYFRLPILVVITGAVLAVMGMKGLI